MSVLKIVSLTTNRRIKRQGYQKDFELPSEGRNKCQNRLSYRFKTTSLKSTIRDSCGNTTLYYLTRNLGPHGSKHKVETSNNKYINSSNL